MPTRPAVHQPHFAKTAEQRRQAELDRMRERDAQRPSSTERGYDRQWRELRAAFIVDHPTCCVPGCGRPTVDVDHVEDVRAHPERRLDATNLRAFCHAHHAQRTAREQGFARPHELRDGARVSTRGALHPDWLRPSRVPLQIVCGPPAAGKSHFVSERALFTELVLDLDEIKASLSGLPMYQPGTAWRGEALRWRNSQLGRLSAPHVNLGGAWLIVGEPTAEWRHWWRERLRPLVLWVIATPAEVCHARIDADPRRELVRDLHHAVVDDWWRRYEPLRRDRVVSAQGG